MLAAQICLLVALLVKLHGSSSLRVCFVKVVGSFLRMLCRRDVVERTYTENVLWA